VQREQRLADLERTPLAAIAPSIERTAATVAQAARAVDAVEEREFARVGRWRRRNRQILDARLEQATATAGSPPDQAESGVDRLRQDMGTITSWWEQNGKLVVDGITARRERYCPRLRARRQACAPSAQAARRYVTQLIGERLADRVEQWSRAAR